MAPTSKTTSPGKKRKMDDAFDSKTNGHGTGKKQMTKSEKLEARKRAEEWALQQQKAAAATAAATPSRPVLSSPSLQKTTTTMATSKTPGTTKSKLKEARERAALWAEQERLKKEMKQKQASGNEIPSPPNPASMMKAPVTDGGGGGRSPKKEISEKDDSGNNVKADDNTKPKVSRTNGTPKSTSSTEKKKKKGSFWIVIVKSLVPILLIWGLSELLPYVDNRYIRNFLHYKDINFIDYVQEKLLSSTPVHHPQTATTKQQHQQEESDDIVVEEQQEESDDIVEEQPQYTEQKKETDMTADAGGVSAERNENSNNEEVGEVEEEDESNEDENPEEGVEADDDGPVQEEEEEEDVFDFTEDDARRMAVSNDVSGLKKVLDQNPEFATIHDSNGWQMIHEAARFCACDVVDYLLGDFSANVDDGMYTIDSNAPTQNNEQLTPLMITTHLCNDQRKKDQCINVLTKYDDVVDEESEESEEEVQDDSDEEEEEEEEEEEDEEEDIIDFTEDDVRTAAYWADITRLKRFMRLRPQWVHLADQNGWTALHEAARQNNLECIKYLIEVGQVNVHAITNSGKSALDLSIESNGVDSEITTYIRAVMQ